MTTPTDISQLLIGRGPMSSMKRTLRYGFPLAIVALALACVDGAVQPLSTVDAALSLSRESDPLATPKWVTDPEVFPEGLKGTSNCSFPFGQSTAQWNFHSDGACWERPGPDGWTRQQQNIVHVPHHAQCGGGPADVSPIRICRAGGRDQQTPCPNGPLTGSNGCALCVPALVCH